MHATPSTTSSHRARWAAIGAAVAVSLGAGGFGLVKAVAPEGASAYIPIEPCRIVDTRPGDGQLGPQEGPLGPDTAITVDGWGDVEGTCNLPTDSTGLQLNVTAVNATQATFLTLYPEGATRPTASNVNVDTPAATPNAATVTLNSANGQFHVYNRFGSVDVVIDVAGYYAAHQHDGNDIINASLTAVDILDEVGFATEDSDEAVLLDSDDDVEIVEVQMRVPADGWVKVDVSGNSWGTTDGRDWAQCQITKASTTINDSETKFNVTDHDGDDVSIIPLLASFSSHRVFEVDVADNPLLFSTGQAFRVICTRTTGTPSIVDATITATYMSTNREAGLIIVPPITLPVITLAEDPADGEG